MMNEKAAEMVAEQIISRGIRDSKVISAMRAVPRELFVPAHLRDSAFEDRPLAIGQGQTISQPYIVALMTECLKIGGDEVVLEVGTGSGYQAAVLSRIARAVYTIEVKEALFRHARRLFKQLGYENIIGKHGDGYFGWGGGARFDAIILTAAVDHVPAPLFGELKVGGRLVLPLGRPPEHQKLALLTKTPERFEVQYVTGVMFVPMTGQAQRRAGLSQKR